MVSKMRYRENCVILFSERSADWQIGKGACIMFFYTVILGNKEIRCVISFYRHR